MLARPGSIVRSDMAREFRSGFLMGFMLGLTRALIRVCFGGLR